MCVVTSCDDLHFPSDIAALNAVPAENVHKVHIGPFNWDHSRKHIRFMYAEEGAAEHRVIILESKCAKKLVAGLLKGLSLADATELLNDFQRDNPQLN